MPAGAGVNARSAPRTGDHAAEPGVDRGAAPAIEPSRSSAGGRAAPGSAGDAVRVGAARSEPAARPNPPASDRPAPPRVGSLEVLRRPPTALALAAAPVSVLAAWAGAAVPAVMRTSSALWCGFQGAAREAARWGASVVAGPPPVTGAESRAFVADLIRASGAHAPDQVRDVLTRHRAVIEHLLDGAALSALTGRPEVPFDLDPIEFANLPGWLLPVLTAARATAAGRACLRASGRRAATLPDEAIERLTERVNQALEAVRFGELPESRALLDPETGLDLDDLPRRIRDMVQLLVSLYFDSLPLDKKRELAALGLELDPEMPVIERTGALVQAAEPGMQKMLQFAAQNARSEEVRAALGQLMSRVAPMPEALVRSRIEAAIQGGEWTDVPGEVAAEPLGSATVAQVHEAKLRRSGATVVVKVQRPDLEARIKREFEAMRRATEDEYVIALLHEAEQLVLAELDFRGEAEAARGLRSAYHLPKDGITVCEPLTEGVLHTDTVLLMKKAPGKGLDDWTRADVEALGYRWSEFLAIKTRVLKKLVKATLRSAVFGSGWVHADLHPGNILLHLEQKPAEGRRGACGVSFRLRPEQRGTGAKRNYLATLLDAGSTTQLAEAQQASVRQVTIGLALGTVAPERGVEVALQGIDRFLSLTQEMRDELRPQVRAAIQGQGSIVEKLLLLISQAIDVGAPINGAAFQWNRARMALQRQYDRARGELEKEAPGEARRFKPITAIYDRVGTRSFLAWLARGRRPIS